MPSTTGAMEPLGTRPPGAMVFVCGGCSEEEIIARFGPELAYEPTGIKSGEFTTALRKLQGDALYEAESERNKKFGIIPGLPKSDADQDHSDHIFETKRRQRSHGKMLGSKAGIRNTRGSIR